MTNAAKPADKTKDLVRSIIALARRSGSKEIRFLPDGVELAGYTGAVTRLAREGVPVAPVVADVAGHLHARYSHGDGWTTDGRGHYDFDNLGTWVKSLDEDGTVRMRSHKPGPPCLEALASFDPGELAGLRALYASEGVDVFLAVEGESRARDMAQAVYAERRGAGLPTTLDMPEKMDRWPYGETADHVGPEPFDQPAPGPAWDVAFLDVKRTWTKDGGYGREIETRGISRLVEALRTDAPGPGSRVLVAQNDHYRGHALKGYAQVAEARARPTAVVVVSLERSAPVARVVLNAPARAIAASPPSFEGAPWETFNARRASTAKARPPAPKTWHPTTEHVAEAYVAREAPRGLVSGKSLFFHGPVAYSMWKDNPIAAYARTADGGEILVMGREPGYGGGKAAIISMAQGDVEKAIGKRMPVLHLDSLSRFLRVGEIGVGHFATLTARKKDEASHPRTCEVDAAGLGKLLSDRHAKALRERDAAYPDKPGHPTSVQVRTARALVESIELRDRLAGLFGVGPSWQFDPLVKLLVAANFASSLWRVAARIMFTTREYGLAEGLRALPRIVVANVIAIIAGRRALFAYVRSLGGASPQWDKTSHRTHPLLVRPELAA